MKFTFPFNLNYKHALFFPFAFAVLLISVGSIQSNIDIFLNPRARLGDAVRADSFVYLIPYQILFILAGYFIIFLIGNVFYSAFKILKIRENKKQVFELLKILSSAAVLNGIYLGLFKPDSVCSGDACWGITSQSAIVYFWSGLISFLCLLFYQNKKQ